MASENAAEIVEELVEGEATSGGFTLLIPNLFEFVPLLIGFLLLWALLAKFGWPAINGMLEKRVERINKDIDSAEQSKIEGLRLVEEKQAELSEAHKISGEILDTARTQAESVKISITDEAKDEAKTIVDKAHENIANEKRIVANELKNSVADIAVAVAGKLLGDDLSDKDQRKLIEKYVAQAGDF